MTTDVIERLQAARDYISDPAHWTDHIRWSRDSIRNCALGAIERAYGRTARNGFTTADDLVAPEIRILAQVSGDRHWEESPQLAVVRLNNEGHQAAVELFNRAIEAAIAELVAETEPETEMACAD